MILTKVVEGKEIGSSSYSSDEFRKLTKAQKDGVKELRSKLKDKRGSDNNSNSNISAATTNTIEQRMSQLEQALVAGVSNASASNEELKEDISVITDNRSNVSGGAASGSAGGYLRQRRNNHGNNNNTNNN